MRNRNIKKVLNSIKVHDGDFSILAGLDINQEGWRTLFNSPLFTDSDADDIVRLLEDGYALNMPSYGKAARPRARVLLALRKRAEVAAAISRAGADKAELRRLRRIQEKLYISGREPIEA